jgi:hypothetical protein
MVCAYRHLQLNLQYNTNTVATPMDHDADDTARLTLDLLEARLRHAEYTVYGHLDAEANSLGQSATQRLHDLEKDLDKLTVKSKVVQDLLRLREFMPPWRQLRSKSSRLMLRYSTS